ncbi:MULTISPECIES: hypothetical protein [Pseudomonas]|uniref:hypothetical protein n=1 Tax=Pseudomonas TaxID=286 RepID=UPI0015DC6AD8|nr:hypothetical protein [Pseudomonas putida]BBR52945.1 hypothetical protein WP4W18C03_12720 [Pseudomonas putida]
MLHSQRFYFNEAVMGKRNLLAIAVAIVVACAWMTGGRYAQEAGLRNAIADCQRQASQEIPGTECSDKEMELTERLGEQPAKSNQFTIQHFT